MALGHDELMNSLADHLAGENRMVWRDMQLGPAGSPRPDVYAIWRSFAHPAPMSYECKVTRSDFQSDVTSGKWQSYLKYSCGVVFACQDDLIKKSDVPTHCGLIVLRGVWRMAKKPVLNPVVVPQDALLKLLIDGVRREGPTVRVRRWNNELASLKISKKFGEVAARTVRDRMAVELEIEYQRESFKRRQEDADKFSEQRSKREIELLAPLRNELIEALKLSTEATTYDIRHAVKKVCDDGEENPHAQRHRMLTAHVRSALERFAYVERPEADEEEVTTATLHPEEP
jgi:hypothetical protein